MQTWCQSFMTSQTASEVKMSRLPCGRRVHTHVHVSNTFAMSLGIPSASSNWVAIVGTADAPGCMNNLLARRLRSLVQCTMCMKPKAIAPLDQGSVCILVQVAVDVPRTAPSVPFFQDPIVQKSLERMLYIWGIRYASCWLLTLLPDSR